MASTNERLGIEIGVDLTDSVAKLNKFGDLLAQLNSKQNDLGKSAQTAGTNLNNAFKSFNLDHLNKIHISISQMTARLTEFYSIRSGLFAIGSEFQTAFHGLVSFNQELHNTAAIANTSTAQMEKLSAAALSVAASSKFSATEVMKSFKELAQAGVSAADLPDVGRTVDMFATGTGATLGQATKVLTTSMNVWQIEAAKSGRISNVLTAALNASKLQVGELSTAMNYLANQSALSGKSLEETTGIIATMANQGLQASTIGTGVSQLLAKLAAPTEKFKTLLKEFGIGLDEISPRANSFADIIKRFETAAIPVERILAALEVRTGRTLATAIQAGSEKFEMMEQRITNTNAAAVAYNESMKGVSAQINVLRGEALTSLNTSLNSLGGSFTDLKENLQDTIVGLRSAEGQFMLFSSAVAVGVTTMTRAALANPILAGLATALAGVTWGISKFGEANRETAKDIDAATKKSAEQSAEYQRKSDGLYTMLSLLDKNKTTEEGYLVVQDKNVKGIRAVMNEFPQLFTGLDLKKLKYSELTEIIKKYNAERGKELSNDISTGNQEADKINALKTALAASIKYEADNENKGVWNIQQFQTAKLKDQLKLAEDSYAKMISANLAPRNDVEIYLDNQGTKRSKKVTPPPDTPRGEAVVIPEKTHSGKTPAERAETILARLATDQKDLAEKLKFQKSKIDRESAEVSLKDKTLTAEEYAEKELKAITLLDKEYADKTLAERTSAYSKLAKALDGAYTQPDTKNPTGHVSFDKRFNDDAVKMLIESTNKNLNYQAGVVDAAAKAKELEKIRLMKPITPEEKDNKLIGVSTDKREDRTMMIAMQTLALKQKAVWTGEELNQLAIGQTEHEIHSLRIKEKAYQTDQETLTLKKEKKGLDTSEQAYLDALPEKLDVIRDKQIQLNALKVEQQGGNQAAFTKGVRTTVQDKTDLNKMSEQLGSGLTTTAIDGLSSSLNGMVDALGRGGNAWQSFANGLGKTMQSIAAELQAYYTRMLVVYGVQKLIGLFASSANPDGFNAPNTTTGFQNGLTTNAGGGWTGGSIYGAMSTPKYAEGGQVLDGIGGGRVPLNMGIPGKLDTIPALVSPGEFIVKRSSVEAMGTEYWTRVNQQRFAEGGLVGGGSGMSSKNTGSGEKQPWNFSIVNVADVNSIPPQPVDTTQVINIVAFDAARRGVIHRVIKGVING